MKSVRGIIATISIVTVGVSGAAASANVSTASRYSARTQLVSCAAISQSPDKAAVGSSTSLKVVMAPYTVTLTGVSQKGDSRTIIHPVSVSISDDGNPVGTASLLDYSGSSLGSMFVGKDPMSSSSDTPESLCLARFVNAEQPAVVVPISGPYIQGNFYTVDIFPLSPDETMLSPIGEDLAIAGGNLVVTNRGVLIQSRDSSFVGRFAAFAYSAGPLVLTVPIFGGSDHYVVGHIEVVTSQYPSLLRADAQRLWAEFVGLPADEDMDSFGVLAAWVADETGLHAQAAALTEVDSAITARHIRFPVYGIKSLHDFDSELRQFLATHGYG